MFRASSSIHAHFAHHVRGHSGPCISIHGHTWKLEVVLEAQALDAQGFVVDFDLLDEKVLRPCFDLLDHSLAIGEATWNETHELLAPLGRSLVTSRKETLGHEGTPPKGHVGELGGARNERPGGIKVAVFPFTPTSERLAEWLYRVADRTFTDDRVRVACGRIYESLHPSESIAEFWG
ncbi:MAG TPA: 6-carboxytetrahydropterin synthase [Polyangiaceae bacterium]|jgi:6-pyruvoyltetrahydropterin/6-carboxytetrahydropterin synthase|nr:6-carboxytetrahydropterin synthase [Polyangiaceae bacterium]